MDSSDITQRILASIAALPLEAQEAAIHELVAAAMASMPIETIHEIRREIVAQFPVDIPVVCSTLDLIDGHLSLRAMGDLNEDLYD